MPKTITENASSAGYQQERLKTIGWVIGFTDGEGCFTVSIVRNKTSSIGWQVMSEYVVTQGESSLKSLEKLKEFFGCGNIFINQRHDNHTENLYRFCIRSNKDLINIVVPFFKKHPLFTTKNNNFLKFANIMDVIEKREHLNQNGMREIALIASQMNTRKTRAFLESPETTRRTPVNSG